MPGQEGFWSHGLTRGSPLCYGTTHYSGCFCLTSQPWCVPPMRQQQAGGGETAMPPEQLCWGQFSPSCPRCALKSSGLGHIQHRAPQPAGSLIAPAPAAAGPGHPKRLFRGGLRPSTPLGLAPAKCPPLRHTLSPAGKSPLALGTSTQEQGRPWGFLVSPARTALLC